MEYETMTIEDRMAYLRLLLKDYSGTNTYLKDELRRLQTLYRNNLLEARATEGQPFCTLDTNED